MRECFFQYFFTRWKTAKNEKPKKREKKRERESVLSGAHNNVLTLKS